MYKYICLNLDNKTVEYISDSINKLLPDNILSQYINNYGNKPIGLIYEYYYDVYTGISDITRYEWGGSKPWMDNSFFNKKKLL